MQTDPAPQSPHRPTRNPWGSPNQVIDLLPGRWSLARVVDGAETNQGAMQGVATFRRLESGLLAYREEGRLRLPNGNTFEAFRDYLYERTESGFAVLFAENPPRLFHAV